MELAGTVAAVAPNQPPGTQPPQRWRPRLHWELLLCSLRGHALEGTEAAELRSQDAVLPRTDSAGTVDMLVMTPTPSSALASTLPEYSRSSSFTTSRWLSVPPDTSLMPPLIRPSARARALSTTCCW